ncbi:MAG: APC family permease [Bryobacteraceae bacterium]|nr:APC family permease [Bryobacteraceae bacterium]
MATDGQPQKSSTAGNTAKVVVATTVALSFISFWRGASIVLSDLASTMFYIGGIVEQSIGPAAPWFVIAILIFGFAIRSVYMESCSMFVRGGVYVVVRDSMGPGMAKISVSALVVDYILTGPISSVSAGHYFAGLINEIVEKLHQPDLQVNANYFAMAFGLIVTGYFWRSNIRGVHESSGHALRIMQITTVMVVMMLIWCGITLLMKDNVSLPPAPLPQNLKWGHGAQGWLEGTFWMQISSVALLVAFGHSLLAMSGFETLAQVYREIGYPKLKNLSITANIVCFYALISTGLISLFAVMIIPDNVRLVFKDNLLGGLTNYLAGPPLLTFTFHVFVVIVGTLILSGAVNASIIGANGVLNRVAEDGVLLDWFRRPHKTFGTTYNIINLIAILQAATILGSRGDVLLLGEAYAFGVTWSFFLKGLGVLALRFQRQDQEYKFPLNLKVGRIELPIGLGATVLMLFFVALANLFSKQIATIYGVSFTLLLFAIFMISERINRGNRGKKDQGLEQFNLEHEEQVEQDAVHVRPGCVLVAVRGYRQMDHLQRVLEKTNLRRHDIVVMSVRPIGGSGEYELSQEQIFTSYEQELFSHVVSMAEKQGKHVELLVVPGLDPFDAMVQTAAKLQCSRLVTGVSATMASDELARRIGQAWERLPDVKHAFSLEIIKPDRPSKFVNLGPHPPRLWPEDVDRVHDIWLELSEKLGLGSNLHHRDVVGVALRRMEQDLQGEDRLKIVEEMKREMGKG